MKMKYHILLPKRESISFDRHILLQMQKSQNWRTQIKLFIKLNRKDSGTDSIKHILLEIGISKTTFVI